MVTQLIMRDNLKDYCEVTE